MGQVSPGAVETKVEVMVAATLDVGRTGITRLGSVVMVEEEDDSPEDAGQEEGPQARSVGQQPPPRLGAQERKPEEHERVAEVEDDVNAVIDIVDVIDVVDGGSEEDDIEIDGDAKPVTVAIFEDELVVDVDWMVLVLDGGEAVTVGLTNTVAVETRAPKNV